MSLNQIDPESSRNDITHARQIEKNTNLALVPSDLRPKGRGRPQRILLGVWPDEHIRGVIRAVVFRDGHSPHMVKEEPTMYPGLANYAACNGPEGAVSPGAAAAAAVAAVAQGNKPDSSPSSPLSKHNNNNINKKKKKLFSVHRRTQDCGIKCAAW